jgi:nucleotidyltransferase substrate binding protein (TIGR01987 family)
MTDNIIYKESLRQLGKALDRLEEILQVPLTENDYVLDAAIQRFEFVIELYWKAFKQILAYENVQTVFPKEALQQAYAAGWLEHEQIWLGMLQDRNKTSHTYKQHKALEIYEHIKIYYPEMRKTYEFLIKKFPITD